MRVPPQHKQKTDQEVFVAVCAEVKMHSSDKRDFGCGSRLMLRLGLSLQSTLNTHYDV